MTIADRNKYLIFSLSVTAVLFIASIGCVFFLISHKLIGDMPTSFSGFQKTVLTQILSYNNAAVIIGIAVFPLLSFLILMAIFFLFEKTHALELSFFCVFIFAVAFESLRLLFPLCNNNYILPFFVTSIVRLIFFFRFLGVLSLLVAGLFAHKVFTRETSWIIFLLCFISFALTHRIPVNASRTESFFLFSRHHRYLLYSFDGILCLLSVQSFFFAGLFRNIPEYTRAGIGLLVTITAYVVLLYTGSWISIIAGIIVFFIGSIAFIRTIHQFYLWQEL